MSDESSVLISLERVAETFSIEIVVLERAVALGLVGLADGRRLLHVEEFDRVAAIVRLHVRLGVELDLVGTLLPGR